MKKITWLIAIAATIAVSACTSKEAKNKKIEDAVTLRVQQICESTDNSTSALDAYGQKLDWLLEQLRDEGISSDEDTKTATDLFDKKLKESCPDKFPK